jgi:hypothetical protein
MDDEDFDSGSEDTDGRGYMVSNHLLQARDSMLVPDVKNLIRMVKSNGRVYKANYTAYRPKKGDYNKLLRRLPELDCEVDFAMPRSESSCPLVVWLPHSNGFYVIEWILGESSDFREDCLEYVLEGPT